MIFDWFVLSMRMQVILDSLDSSFARPGSAPIWGGKKGEFRDWTNKPVVLVFAASPYWCDPTRLKQLSMFAILGFQFALYNVFVPLNFLRSYQPCFIVTFLILADQVFYSSYVYQQHFRVCGHLHHYIKKFLQAHIWLSSELSQWTLSNQQYI